MYTSELMLQRRYTGSIYYVEWIDSR